MRTRLCLGAAAYVLPAEAALGAMVWECGMWLCVLRPGPLCALGLLAGFMFHQSVRWSTSISFNDQQDVYLLSLPLLLGRLRGPGGTHEPARRARALAVSRAQPVAATLERGHHLVRGSVRVRVRVRVRVGVRVRVRV